MRRKFVRLLSLSPSQWRVALVSTPLLPLVHVLLHRRGLAWTADLLARRSNRGAVSPNLALARAWGDAVNLVAGRSFVGVRCLGRSLVLWFLLRRRGIDAELVIGADAPRGGTLPAHAWVEVEGEAVNDVSTVREQFSSFGLSLPRLAGTADR
jgi:hypothetical protein